MDIGELIKLTGQYNVYKYAILLLAMDKLNTLL